MECTECQSPITESDRRVKRLKKLFCSSCWTAYCTGRFKRRLFELSSRESVRQLSTSTGHPVTLDDLRETYLLHYDGSDSSKALLNMLIQVAKTSASVQQLQLQLQQNHSRGDGQQSHHGRTIPPFPFKFILLFIFEEYSADEEKKLTDLRSWLKKEMDLTTDLFLTQSPLIISSLELSTLIIDKNTVPVSQDHNISSSRILKKCNFTGDETLTIVSLREISEKNSSRICHFSNVLEDIKSQSSREDFLRILRQNLMLVIGTELSVSGILISEDQTFLAVKMFTMMGLGRGGEIARQMTLTTTYSMCGGLKIVRPLYEISSDDLRDYLDNLEESSVKSSTAGKDKGRKRIGKDASISNHVEGFILGLQRDFPATVSTLSKIGAKLESGDPQGKNDDNQQEVDGPRDEIDLKYCPFCLQINSELRPVPLSNGLLKLCHGCSNILRDSVNPGRFTRQVFQLDLQLKV